MDEIFCIHISIHISLCSSIVFFCRTLKFSGECWDVCFSVNFCKVLLMGECTQGLPCFLPVCLHFLLLQLPWPTYTNKQGRPSVPCLSLDNFLKNYLSVAFLSFLCFFFFYSLTYLSHKDCAYFFVRVHRFCCLWIRLIF